MPKGARIGLVAIALVLSACGSAGEDAGRVADGPVGQAAAKAAEEAAAEAASRFTAAIDHISQALGLSHDQVEQSFRTKLPADTPIDVLATEAERSSGLMDSFKQAAAEQAAAEAAAAEQAKYFEAIHEAGCDAIKIYGDPNKTQEQRDEALREVIREHLNSRGLSGDDATVAAVFSAVAKQFDYFFKNGTFDPNEALIDFACAA